MDEEESSYWCDGYFWDRDAVDTSQSSLALNVASASSQHSTQSSQHITLPILHRARRRSRSPRHVGSACRGSWLDLFRDNNATGRSHMLLPDAARFVGPSDQFANLMREVLPNLERSSTPYAAASLNFQDMLQEPLIHVGTNYIRMSDHQAMLDSFLQCEFRGNRCMRRIYVGITEHPIRRLHMHVAERQLFFSSMQIVRIKWSGKETAA